MYTPIFNRLCGWLFFALGLVGFTTGSVENYIRVSTFEGIAYTAIGLLGMVTARLRHRDATFFSLLFGLMLFGWGVAGFVWPVTWMGTSEPLENAVRLVAGLWGMYASVNDVLAWRTSLARPS